MVLVLSSQPFRIFPFAFVYLLIDIINLQAVLFVFDLTKYIFFAQNLSMCAKDHLVFRDEMDIMDYPAGMVETVLRVEKAWQVHLDHVV